MQTVPSSHGGVPKRRARTAGSACTVASCAGLRLWADLRSLASYRACRSSRAHIITQSVALNDQIAAPPECLGGVPKQLAGLEWPARIERGVAKSRPCAPRFNS